ncbi:hypothetical protein NXG27_07255 [Megasphaera paucivorans]|uniref:DUF927 domain-containing protein n=1 Tax=Megasphaera paucivorans TaxID=349095 RepID=A0A1G9X0W4_9FIRM|nr:hypothetical protein [Megasphaera paucivorans]SDM90151.1 hypothetical protein SAMN05660299_01729 [Megasphaera paucivorans]
MSEDKNKIEVAKRVARVVPEAKNGKIDVATRVQGFNQTIPESKKISSIMPTLGMKRMSLGTIPGDDNRCMTSSIVKPPGKLPVTSTLQELGDGYYLGTDGLYMINHNDTIVRFSNFSVYIQEKYVSIDEEDNRTESVNLMIIVDSKKYEFPIPVRRYKSLMHFLDGNIPECTLFSERVRTAKECLKHALSLLYGKYQGPVTEKYSYFGWSHKRSDGTRYFLHGGRNDCLSVKKLVAMENIKTADLKTALQVFQIAGKRVVYPLMLYQAEAFLDALFTDAKHPIQHTLMAVACSGSKKTSLFRVIFAPFDSEEDKAYTVRSTEASMKILHGKHRDDVFVVDDFNEEGTKIQIQAVINKIHHLVRAYSDKTPQAMYAGPNRIRKYCIRGGCVFTAEEEIAGEILSASVRYLKVYFDTLPNENILTLFQDNPQLLQQFWSAFIYYVEANYANIVGYIKSTFNCMRQTEKKFKFDRLKDTGIAMTITAYVMAQFLKEAGLSTNEEASQWVQDVHQTIFDLVSRQDQQTNPLRPEVKFLVALYDCMGSGQLQIASDLSHYIANLSQYRGYWDKETIMLQASNSYVLASDYYRQKDDHLGISERELCKILKAKNLIEHDTTGCLKKASSLIPGRPRMLCLKDELCRQTIEKNREAI